jgi:serine acetyltransferase
VTAPIAIGNDVYIGVNAIILAGVTIGNRCIIGAGTVVTKSIPDNSVAVGVPARVVKTVDEYLEGAKARSLHVGHIRELDKEGALRRLLRARPAECYRGTKARK